MGTGGCVVAAKSVKEAASVSIADNAITARSVKSQILRFIYHKLDMTARAGTQSLQGVWHIYYQEQV